ncbi:RHS repeat-associated core domain-containing protein [Aeromonas jandaei]|uniref:RHS repeat-associated core domain-containing protein n=1 Tax=Aeromonas jandaei TaxID=650 RepID=UPI001ABF2EB0|nr:RHS repeat-associated core domain-containing protein [Aeromonas jandaei]QSR71959.1 hypothetical protein GP488_05720 [Aeromonas jandaei]
MNEKLISRRDFISTSITLAVAPILPVPIIAYEQEGASTIATSNQILKSPIGFNGAFNDKVIHAQHLGDGYRIYNPFLMRFHIQDSWSPFSKGGVNAYGYVSGDPLNYVDPSGHMMKSTIVTPRKPESPKSPIRRPLLQLQYSIPGMTKLQTKNSKWKIYSGKEGKIEIVAIGEVIGSDVDMASNALERKPSIKKRRINIYSGIHGFPDGKNWDINGGAKSIETDFSFDDIVFLHGRNSGRNNVVTLPYISKGRNGYIEKTADPYTHGIHAYCYSERDESFQRAMSSTGMKHIGFL